MFKFIKKIIFMFVLLNSWILAFYCVKFLNRRLRSNVNLTGEDLLQTELSTSEEDTKYILFWIPMWDSKTFNFGAGGFELFRHCEFTNCFATHNRNLIPIENFDAIVFHAAQFNVKKHGKPGARKPHQRYIFANIETPVRAYPANLRRFRSFYNWTMTYRHDSDIVRPYGYIMENKTNYILPSTEFIKRKTRLAAWFVSNCYTINRREYLYRNLKKYIDIDVYGACSEKECPKISHESSKNCYDMMEQNYKFYLSFENSHCVDYVTEKLYKILQRNIVPIVYGNANYKTIAPPYSVIVTDSFINAKQLANYLLYLDKNPEEYLNYFKWKKLYYVEINENRTVCALCKKLHDPLESPKIYEDIFTWWTGKNLTSCRIGNNLPNISILNM